MSSLLPYENQIFIDLIHNDGLLVLAEGLGIERIFLNIVKLYCSPTHFVLIINTSEEEENYFLSKLKQANVVDLPKRITTETHSINERTQAYMQGGCYFITTRILVVDLLTDRIPVDLINGILVYKAHKIVDSCQETFILRLFRQKNKVCSF
jgi:DNA excision repair protein ERCC-4